MGRHGGNTGLGGYPVQFFAAFALVRPLRQLEIPETVFSEFASGDQRCQPEWLNKCSLAANAIQSRKRCKFFFVIIVADRAQ